MEDAIAHTTMPLNEEKKMVTAIKDLGKSRETVREYQTSYSTLNGDDGTRKAVVDKLKAKDLEITALKVRGFPIEHIPPCAIAHTRETDTFSAFIVPGRTKRVKRRLDGHKKTGRQSRR